MNRNNLCHSLLVWLPLPALMLIATASGAIAGQQIISVGTTPLTIAPGETATVTVSYTSSDENYLLSGLGLRMHYNSSLLELEISDILDEGGLIQTAEAADSADLDEESATDRYHLFAWASMAGQWPGQPLPIALYTVRITAREEFSGNTTINFSAADTANGYQLSASPLILTASTDTEFDITVPRDFVEQQYRDFLGREGEEEGVTFWAAELAAGNVTRAQVADLFFSSDEFQNNIAPVARLYFAYFDRIPDFEGLDYWVEVFQASGALAGMSQAFADSLEFASMYGELSDEDFVDLVYQNVLGRSADAEGRAYWAGQLAAGMSRGEMMAGFSESEEYRTRSYRQVQVTMMYGAMLRRAPDQGGFDYWVAALAAGGSVLELVGGFLDSSEYGSRFPSSAQSSANFTPPPARLAATNNPEPALPDSAAPAPDAANDRVLFLSRANNLVAGPQNGALQLYVAELESGQIRRLTETTAGQPADGDTGAFAVGGDWVLFQTAAENLEGGPGLYRQNLRHGWREVAVHGPAVGQADPLAQRPALDAAGELLAFDRPDSTGKSRVYTTTPGTPYPLRQSADDPETAACCAALSANGRYLAWQETGGDSRPYLLISDLAHGARVQLPWPQDLDPSGPVTLEFSPDSRQLRLRPIATDGRIAPPLHVSSNPLAGDL